MNQGKEDNIKIITKKTTTGITTTIKITTTTGITTITKITTTKEKEERENKNTEKITIIIITTTETTGNRKTSMFQETQKEIITIQKTNTIEMKIETICRQRTIKNISNKMTEMKKILRKNSRKKLNKLLRSNLRNY